MNLGLCRFCGKMVVIEDSTLMGEWSRVVADAPPELQERSQQWISDFATALAPGINHITCIRIFEDQEKRSSAARFRVTKAMAWQKSCPFKDSDINRIPFTRKEEAINAFAEPGVSVVLIGPTRRGKTRLSFMMLEAPFLTGKTLRVFTHVGLKNLFLEKTQKGGGWLSLFSSQLKECDILFIDDLGKATMVDANGRGLQVEEQFFDVIDHRLMHKKKTLLTANDTGKTFTSRMSKDRGEPFAARIDELARVFDG